jgi:predicted O-methyltransferase YrrM
LRESVNTQSFARFEGMISEEEAQLLHRLAARTRTGCIVEIGSWRGKSAIALATGAKTLPPAARPMVYSIDPHAEFVGIFGGKFGPRDRVAYFKALLDADCAENVALVNLGSIDAAKAWQKPIGLLFIDGDHTEAAVQADVDAWTPFVAEGGIVVFDDALNETAGPARVIAKMLAGGAYRKLESVRKIVVLEKAGRKDRAEAQAARRIAVADIRARAERAGYDPEFALARLGYGSFVSLANRYLYVESPKTACTAIKRMLVGIEGAHFERNARPYHRETRRDMLIHQRRHVGIPTLQDIPAPERDEILAGSSDWFAFAIARNPFSRLVSVFENKIRVGEPRYRALEAAYGDRGAFADPRSAFAAFVRDVIADPDQRNDDPHFSSQVRLLMPLLIPYTHIFWFEHIEQAVAALRQHLSARGMSVPVELARENVSLANPWRDYYDEATAHAVADAYAEDFREFGYDPQDWRGGQQLVADTEADRRWRAEVVERNAFIHQMFDWLNPQRSG